MDMMAGNNDVWELSLGGCGARTAPAYSEWLLAAGFSLKASLDALVGRLLKEPVSRSAAVRCNLASVSPARCVASAGSGAEGCPLPVRQAAVVCYRYSLAQQCTPCGLRSCSTA